MLGKKLQHAFLGVFLGKGRSLDLVDKAAFGVRRLVPVVHGVEQFVGLMNHQHRALGHQAQIGLGNHYRQFDDAFFFGVKPGHFHIDPNQTLIVRRHIIL